MRCKHLPTQVVASDRPPCLSSHILSEQIRLGPAATGDLTLLLNSIGFASKFIASNVRKARLINLFVPPIRSHAHIFVAIADFHD